MIRAKYIAWETYLLHTQHVGPSISIYIDPSISPSSLLSSSEIEENESSLSISNFGFFLLGSNSELELSSSMSVSPKPENMAK